MPDILEGGAWVLADHLLRDSKQSGRSALGGIRLDEDSRWSNAKLVRDCTNGSGENRFLSRQRIVCGATDVGLLQHLGEGDAQSRTAPLDPFGREFHRNIVLFTSTLSNRSCVY